MAKREFLMLAHVLKPEENQSLEGWFASEKLDGQRAYWDGGVSRGMLKSQVPWANTDKDDRYVTPPVATGLWSRYGNVIHAPDYWLDTLPPIPLDGELWLDRGEGARQELSKIIKLLEPDSRWRQVRFMVFDSPPYSNMFASGEINTTNFKKKIDYAQVMKFVGDRDHIPLLWTFTDVIQYLIEQLKESTYAKCHKQIVVQHQAQIFEMLDEVTSAGGEGLIVKAPNTLWVPQRSHKMLKIKKLQDAEAIVTGYVTGRKTALGSKLLGKMGALITNFNGKHLELSGFTDEERKFHCYQAEEWAAHNPGCEVPDWITNLNFPRGSVVTFRYRELSADGIPIEARYWRKRGSETLVSK